MALAIHLLGPIEAVLEGRPVALGTGKQRAVLAMLALEPNRTVSTDRLIHGLWGEGAPPTAPKMVQRHISQLRKALPDGDARIVTHGRGYELAVAPDAVDALLFERLVSDAAALEDGSGDGLAREALALWRGRPLADLEDEPFARPEVRRLEELWLRAKEISIDAQLADGRHEDALAEVEPLVADHPLRERLHEQLMLALYRSGRQADALAAYRAARRTLVDEVGVEPGPPLRRLHEAILHQDPALDVTSDRAPPPPPGSSESAPAAGTATTPAGRAGLGRRVLIAGAAIAVIAAVVVLVTSRDGDDAQARIAEDTIVALEPDGSDVSARYEVGRGPVALAAGAGYVWAANELDGTVSRVDPGGDGVATVDVGGDPVSLAFAGDSLWVADGGSRSVAQVDPVGARVVQRIDVGGGLRGLAAGGGALWVAAALDGTVHRVDLSEGRVTQRIPIGGTPTALAFGAGALWVASEVGGLVLRIDPRSGRVLDAVNVGNGPSAVVVGDGAVWTANRQDGTVSRIDPATAAVTETIRVGRGPVAIAVGAGAVWTANAEDGTLSRIDLASRRVTDTIATGDSSPSALVPVDEAMWAAARPARESHRGGTLRVRLRPPDPPCRCADPAAYDAAGWPLVSVAYDALLAYRRSSGAAGGTLVGGLATGLPRVSDEGRTYAFRLRDGLRYSDGRPVRTEDVRASLERLLEIDAATEDFTLPDYFSALPGARACARGAPCDLSEAIEVDEAARTVTFRLRRPDSELLHKLALPLAAIIPADTPRRLVTATPPAGTGPYRIASFDGRRGARLERNEHFRARSLDARPDGFPDAIAVTFAVPDTTRDAGAVERGDADLAVLTTGYDTPDASATIRALLTRHAGRLVPGQQLETDYMFLNVRAPPFDDARVRRAVNYATDRARVAELAGGLEVARPTCQVLPPEMPGYRPFCPWTHDPGPGGEWRAPDLARARRLVAESGTRGQEVTVWTPREFRELARYFRGLLGDLGYRSDVRVLPSFPAYFPVVVDSRRRAQIGGYGWLADYVAPSTFIAPVFSCSERIPRSPANPNVAQFCDPQLDRMMRRALTRPVADPAATTDLWHAIDRRLVEAAPLVPLVNRRDAVLVSERVGNVQVHPFWGPLLDQAWVR